MDKSPVRPGNLEEKIIQFLFVESISFYIRNLQYRSKIPPPNIEWWESQRETQLAVRGTRSEPAESIATEINNTIMCSRLRNTA